MISVQQRRRAILDELEKKGFVRVLELAESLGVTGATIRSDLRILDIQNKLSRSHGGAIPVKKKVVDLPVQEKSFICQAEKKSIAIAAAALISEDDSIIMTSGSTIEALARYLKPKGRLNVVTPSIRVGVSLSEKENVDVLMLGGHIVKKSLSVRDTYTLEGLKNVKCSKLYFSCDGFDPESGITTAYVEEARITNAMMDAATRVILLADSSKFGTIGFGKICDFSRIDILITDSGIDKDFAKELKEAGIEVIVA